jgi:hypothetical protein
MLALALLAWAWVCSLLSAVYIGHWAFKGQGYAWDSPEGLVTTCYRIFMMGFNTLQYFFPLSNII